MPNCDKAPPPQDDDDPEQPFDPDLPLDGPDQGCQLTHGCPGEDVPGDEDEPCRSDLDARTNCEGGTDGTPTDDGTTGGTDGTDGGTTGGSSGRLPKTGVEIMGLVGLGAGGLGLGAVLKRLGRRSQDQDQ